MDTKPRSSLGQVIRLFLRLGFTAFGGPAAHIAMMHDEVVVRRRWLDEQHFLDLVGATNLIPGPNSTEMAIHIGYDRAGWRGLVAAGVCFILPATLIVGSLAWAYVAYGRTPQGEALLYGINVAALGLMAGVTWQLGQEAIVDGVTLFLAVGAMILLFRFKLNSAWLVLVGVSPD
ncbi:MAG TPA: chromate transporter [Anaerolineae bacterium]